MSSDSDRRGFLQAAGLGAMALGLGAASSPALAVPESRRRSVSIAHLTDMHVQPERKGAEGLAACLKHIMNLKQKPDMIVVGGDMIMDSFEADDARTKQQWDLFTAAFRENTNLPVKYCLGNHDIWGWDKTKSKTTGSEPGWGKQRAMDILKMSAPFYSFDQGGWRIIVLDSVQPRGEGYIGRLDPEGVNQDAEGTQFQWLARELAATPSRTPVCVVSHIPILCAGNMISDGRMSENGMQIGAASQLTDVHKIVDLFSRYPNVKLCLSGHIHLNDRIDFQGVTYLCNGAVSGAWWRGREAYRKILNERAKPGDPIRPYRSDEGYALVDLFTDGSFAYVYVKYGWQAVAE
jgi:Icc protein